MTQEYEPIKFNKASEAVAYLEDGGKLFCISVGQDQSKCVVEITTVDAVVLYNSQYLHTEKKPAPWYERLNGTLENGVLCWVSDVNEHPDNRSVLDIICSKPYKFLGRWYIEWLYATPLSSEEVEKILATHKRLGL